MRAWLDDTEHAIAIAPTGLPGEWRTYCPGCSAVTGDPVVRCDVYPEQWPEMSTLFEAVTWP